MVGQDSPTSVKVCVADCGAAVAAHAAADCEAALHEVEAVVAQHVVVGDEVLVHHDVVAGAAEPLVQHEVWVEGVAVVESHAEALD